MQKAKGKRLTKSSAALDQCHTACCLDIADPEKTAKFILRRCPVLSLGAASARRERLRGRRRRLAAWLFVALEAKWGFQADEP